MLARMINHVKAAGRGGRGGGLLKLVLWMYIFPPCCLNPLVFSLQGDAQFSEAVGYPMVQRWRVRSNLYRVKLSSITLSTGQCQNPPPSQLQKRNGALINPQNRHYAAFTAIDQLTRPRWAPFKLYIIFNLH